MALKKIMTFLKSYKLMKILESLYILMFCSNFFLYLALYSHRELQMSSIVLIIQFLYQD